MKFNNRGQTLIEVVVALSVVMLILAAISVAVTTSLSNSTYLKNHNLASKYAQDGIEYIRHLYENQENFYESFPAGSRYFMDETNTISQGFFEQNIGSEFVREVRFESGIECDENTAGADELRVTVSVYWTSGKCAREIQNPTLEEQYCHKSELVTCFTQRRSGFTL